MTRFQGVVDLIDLKNINLQYVNPQSSQLMIKSGIARLSSPAHVSNPTDQANVVRLRCGTFSKVTINSPQR